MGATTRGYTLVEVMMVLVILGVAAAMTGPSLRRWTAKVRVQAALNLVATDLAHARIQAVRSGRGAVVRFQASGDCGGRRAGHRYVVVARPARVVRSTSVRMDGARVCLEYTNSDTVAFNSRGLLVPFANRTIRATAVRGQVRDSLTLSVAGRIFRRF
ncbi:MAG TPA: GspH/FimT family pseudopilin [Longimicrobium sp.]|nr:GspH/FimT family pseudopilin [Longimicrobium sp.]